jgi:hypothetical protein
MTSTAAFCIFLEIPKQIDEDEIIEILDQAKASILSGMKRWLVLTLKFSKYLIKNQFLISSVWRTWRRLGAIIFQGLLHYH